MYTMSQILLDSLKKQGYTPYPNKFVTAKVVKIGHTASFTGAGGVQGEILNFVLADSTTAMLATMNDPTKFKQLKEGKTFIIRNFVVKGCKVVCTEKTKILQTREIELSKEKEQTAINLLIPPSPTKTIKEARSMPSKEVITVCGEIVKDEAMRTVKVAGVDTDIRTITVREDGYTIDITLWRDIAGFKCTVGMYVKITNCITGEWQKATVLNTSRKSVISEIEIPETSLTGLLCGVSVNELKTDITVDVDGNLHDFSVPTEKLKAALDEDMETIFEIIPVTVQICSKGTTVISIEKTD